MKMNSTAFVIEEMHIKNTMKYYHTSIKMNKWNRFTMASIGKELEFSYTAAGDVNRRMIRENILERSRT